MDVIEKDREIEKLSYKVGWQSAALTATVEALKDERIEREKLQKRLDDCASEALRKISALEEQLSAHRKALHKSR